MLGRVLSFLKAVVVLLVIFGSLEVGRRVSGGRVWLTVAVWIVIMAAVYALNAIVSGVFHARRRERFVSEHTPMTDDEFCDSLDVQDPLKRAACAAIRKAVARKIGVPAERLHPSDGLYGIFGLRHSIPNILEAAGMALERQVGAKLNHMHRYQQGRARIGPLYQETFGQFVAWWLDNWELLVP